MGITGLWKILEPTATEIPLECLEGKKLAVDVSIWIYQAQLAYPSDQPYPHLRLLVNRLSKLLFYKIRPIFVFDGPNIPPLKRQVLEARRQKRLNDDDVLTNTKKIGMLKEIAGGQLNDDALANAIKQVISPSKKSIRSDIYKEVPAAELNLEKSSAHEMDQLAYRSDDSSDSDSSDIIIETPKATDNRFGNEPNSFVSKKQEIQSLVDKREVMRNSRLRPDMIPQDSKTFSNFQIQRILQKGRLNAQIDQLSRFTSATSSATDKINVTGPDGTSHILKYSYSDEIEVVKPELKREIDSLYHVPLDMTLDVFNVEYGGKTLKREVTPDDVREDILEGLEERLVDKKEQRYQSKSGMLEAIARKRIRQHYGSGNIEDKIEEEKRIKKEKEEDDLVVVSDDEIVIQHVLLESASKNLSEKCSSMRKHVFDEDRREEEEWDPQRNDEPSTSSATYSNFSDNYVHLNYTGDNDKTPELYRDLQEFLTNAGIPWIEAPGEAEAQCVELERLGLVDGVVSDDSDVWAFGVKHVFRHMFAKNKRVQRYGKITAANNENFKLFCLQREDYISIALLSGGDYCAGLAKVGAIGALELVSEYVGCRSDALDDLKIVENRIIELLEKVKQLFLSSPDEQRLPSRTVMILRRHVTESNEIGVIKNVCSNVDAIHAYLHPVVDSSSEKFRWRQMNIPLIRQILHQRFQWPDRNQHNEEKNLFDAFEKWNTFLQSGGQSQLRLDRFFSEAMDSSLQLKWSKRVMEAMEKIRKRTAGFVQKEEKSRLKMAAEDVKKVKIQPKKNNLTSARGRGRGRRGKVEARSAKHQKKKELNLSEESSSGESFD